MIELKPTNHLGEINFRQPYKITLTDRHDPAKNLGQTHKP